MSDIIIRMEKAYQRPSIHLHGKQPSASQKEAGNYKKHKSVFAGLPVTIENPAGSVRSGVDPSGKPWRSLMQFDYGYIRGTEGLDGDHVDIVIGPDEGARNTFIVTTRKAPDFKKNDEQKVFVGFPDAHQAKEAFMGMYDRPEHFGSMGWMPTDQFVSWCKDIANRGKEIPTTPTEIKPIVVRL